MNKPFAGNDDAFRQLESYLRMKSPGPLILSGNPGLGKRLAAEEAACALIGCSREQLSRSPDFYLLDRHGAGIKVEDILLLLDKSRTAAVGKRKVYVICQAQNMNPQAQNKLLKLLEDKNSTNTVIMLCERDTLLETIVSRSVTVRFHPLSDEQALSLLSSQGITGTDARLAAFICNNCPYNAGELAAYFEPLKETYHAMRALGSRREILKVLHLVREKDEKEFYAVHSAHYVQALAMFQYLFFGLLAHKTAPDAGGTDADCGTIQELYTVPELIQICEEISRHQKQWVSGTYTKNDFFDLARTMIQVSIH